MVQKSLTVKPHRQWYSLPHVWEVLKVERTRRPEITKEEVAAVGQTRKAIVWPASELKGRTYDIFRYSSRYGTLISATAVTQCRMVTAVEIVLVLSKVTAARSDLTTPCCHIRQHVMKLVPLFPQQLQSQQLQSQTVCISLNGRDS